MPTPTTLTLGQARAELASAAPSAELTARINLACERLLAMGKWRGLMDRIAVRATGGLFSLPMDYESCVSATLEGAPVRIRTPWYEFMPGGWGTPDLERYPVPIDRGLHAAFFDPENTDTGAEGLVFATETSDDDGTTVTAAGEGPENQSSGTVEIEAGVPSVTGAGTTGANGTDWTLSGTDSETGRNIYSRAEGAYLFAWSSGFWELIGPSGVLYYTEASASEPWDTEAAWVAHLGSAPAPTVTEGTATMETPLEGNTYGEPSRYSNSIDAPGTLSAFSFNRITSLSKPRTTGRIFVTGATSGSLLAVLEPRDTVYSIRRYAVPGSDNSDTGEQIVVAFCKRAFRRASEDSDPLAVDSVYAIRMALSALQYEDEGDAKESLTFWAMARKHLDDALSEYRGSSARVLPIHNRASGGHRLRSIR